MKAFAPSPAGGHWVLHVDLDQFLAAVEVLRRPELRGLPVVVGGDGDPTKRGVVSTASYEAREYGVHSGVALRTAVRLCPEAVFLAVDRPVYEAASARVMTTLRESGAVVEVLGWDEAFLGLETSDPEAVARRIQQRVREETDLDCSVGIGQNKLQAKLATDFGKPADLPPDLCHVVRGARRAADGRAVGHRPQVGPAAGTTLRYPHGGRARRGGPPDPDCRVRSPNRALADPAGLWRG